MLPTRTTRVVYGVGAIVLGIVMFVAALIWQRSMGADASGTAPAASVVAVILLLLGVIVFIYGCLLVLIASIRLRQAGDEHDQLSDTVLPDGITSEESDDSLQPSPPTKPNAPPGT